jgi:hypothetical protein
MNTNIPAFDFHVIGIAEDPTQVFKARIHAIRCRAGKPITFHAHLPTGAHYSLIPIHKLIANPKTKPLTAPDLQEYDCFSDHCEVLVYDYFRFRRVIHKTLGPADYLFTIDFFDNPFSDNPEEFKQFHVIKTDSGHIAAAPNNFMLFQEKTYTGTPDWRLQPRLTRQTQKDYKSAEQL